MASVIYGTVIPVSASACHSSEKKVVAPRYPWASFDFDEDVVCFASYVLRYDSAVIMNCQFADLTGPFSIRSSTLKNRGRLRFLVTEKGLSEGSFNGRHAKPKTLYWLLVASHRRPFSCVII